MKPYFVLLTFLLLIHTGCKKQPEPASPQLIEFTAQRVDVRLNGELPSSEEPTVTIKANAIVYDPAIAISDLTKPTVRLDPTVQFVLDYHKAVSSADIDKILPMWRSEEQKEKSDLLQRDGVLASVKKFYDENRDLKILAILYQDNTQTVLLKHAGLVIGMTVTEENGKLKLTDHPDDDLEVAIVEASLMKTNL